MKSMVVAVAIACLSVGTVSAAWADEAPTQSRAAHLLVSQTANRPENTSAQRAERLSTVATRINRFTNERRGTQENPILPEGMVVRMTRMGSLAVGTEF